MNKMDRVNRGGLWIWVALVALWMSGCGTVGVRPDLSELTHAELDQKIHDDLVQIRRYDEGLSRTLTYAGAHKELFEQGRDGVTDLSAPQKRELLEIWREVLDYMIALDGIKSYWQDYRTVSKVSRRRAHAEAYLTGYLAWVVQHRHGLTFIDLTLPSASLETILDEAHPDLGIPAGAFATLKYHVINVEAVWQLLSGREHLRWSEQALADGACSEDPACAWALEVAVPYARQARRKLANKGLVHFGYNAYDIVRDASFEVWFPVQTSVARWMGDTKVRRLHQQLVTAAQLDRLTSMLIPGDILVVRHNWYLSNIGLPGFWPHAELYVGSPGDLDAAFGPADSGGLVPEGGTMSAMLAAKYPEAWAAYTTPAASGAQRRILEAVSEGVVFNSVGVAAGADYVAAMHPEKSKAAAAAAIDRAFSLHGRPYDFDFDFLSDESLVCTELVVKSWQPDTNKDGISFALESIVGRTTLPANSIVRAFDVGYDSEPRDLGFVAFLDGREAQGDAVFADLATFRSSWRRPKWDILQQ